ncbi:DUF4153 domain-containing protein [Anaerosphaera multitolerans]|uniref:DUF4153 domain-containing protein n=1 Tax=Anaerosphaera multitolerans TaxID=2487351 RepID=A0A437S520_9FIRM|nr:DUF4153 domain-containing protein [Anaerosphaera multitolerans]RVU54113.1 DUF4153 domain-containing protein [Anaerosphaera multitolerans]
MKVFYIIKGALNKTKKSFERFPIPMACIILSALFFILDINNKMNVEVANVSLNTSNIKFGYLYLMATFIYIFIKLFNEGFLISTTTTEQLKKIKYLKVIIYILSIPLLYGVYKLLITEDQQLFLYENLYEYFGLLLFFIVSSFYVSKIFYNKDYSVYLIKFLTAIAISTVYSVILFAGLSAIFYASERLLGIAVSETAYIKTGIIVFMPFNLGVFLANLPNAMDSFSNYELTKPTKILIVYILIPIFSVYLLILYLYFGKILIQRQWPQGIITNLVLWFSTLSIIFLFILKVIKDNNLAEYFKKYFPVALLPALFMMFLSMGIRINQYGLTESRYFVIAAGVFSVISILYFIFFKDNSSILIPVILSVIIIVSSLGPISAYSLSRGSQNRRFTKVLVKNNMLKGNKIVPNSNISEEDREQIVSVVNYMINNHRPWELKYIPKDFELNGSNFEETFGFSSSIYSENDFIDYYFEGNSALDISGYSKIMKFSLSSDMIDMPIQSVGNYRISLAGDSIVLDYVDEENVLNIATINSKEVFDKVRVLKKAKGIIEPDNLAVSGISNGIKYKIIFTSLSEQRLTEKDRFYYMEFYLLVDNKFKLSNLKTVETKPQLMKSEL